MATVPVAPAASRSSAGALVDWRFLTLAGFALWVLVVGSHHEPCFDEAQAWLLARDSNPWQLLGERVRYEGTPGLWHLTLWLAIRAGLPYSELYLLSAAFATAGAAVVLWRSPFPAPLRLAVLGSYFFGYQFSVVARSYCLYLLLVPLAATFFASRSERPVRYAVVVGLIANVSAHGFMVAGILGLELVWRLWRARGLLRMPGAGGVSLAGAMGATALFCAWQPSDNGYLSQIMRGDPAAYAMSYVGNAFVNRIIVWNDGPAGTFEIMLAVALSFLALASLARLVKAETRALAFGIVTALIGFAAFVYSGLWHAGILFVFWIFLLWIEWSNPVSKMARWQVVIAMSAICVAQTVQTVRSGLYDIDDVYSPGEQAAKAVEDYRRDHPEARIAAFNAGSFVIQPWLPGNPFANYHAGAARPSYVIWATDEPWPAMGRLAEWKRLLADNPDLIVASPMNKDRVPQFHRLACRMGYGLQQSYPSAFIWRGAKQGDGALFLYERGTKGCNGLAPAGQSGPS